MTAPHKAAWLGCRLPFSVCAAPLGRVGGGAVHRGLPPPSPDQTGGAGSEGGGGIPGLACGGHGVPRPGAGSEGLPARPSSASFLCSGGLSSRFRAPLRREGEPRRLLLLRLRGRDEKALRRARRLPPAPGTWGLPPGDCQSLVTCGVRAAGAEPAVRGWELPGRLFPAEVRRRGARPPRRWSRDAPARPPRVRTRAALPGCWGDSCGPGRREGAARLPGLLVSSPAAGR